MKNSVKNLLLALALSLPMLVFFLGYFIQHSPELRPTGFIQYDNVSYIAYAKQYLDAGGFHFLYSNPFSDHEGTPIYFQAQTFFFALLLKLGIPAGWILIPFQLLCAVICFRLLAAIYDKLQPEKKFRTWNIWLLCWGGGLLTFAGMFYYAITQPNVPFTEGILSLDPEKGWWGLNQGRALFFSCEAYYHALFYSCIFFLLQKKWLPALIVLAILSLSHPFTGIELIVIVLLYCGWELLQRKKSIPAWFVGGVVIICAFHLWYYLVYLEKFPEHASVSQQYALNWKLRWYRMLPAYGITGALALASVYSAGLRNFFSYPSNRLLAAWFLGAFLLSNHELFITARQPVHFTRGYIWTSLFLLGLPALQRTDQFLKRRYGKVALVVMGIIFFADNAYWIFNNIRARSVNPYTSYITSEQERVFDILNDKSSGHTLLVSTDPVMGYLGSVYTKSYPYYSHPFTTPFALEKWKVMKNFSEKGTIDSSWRHKEVDFLVRTKDSAAFHSLLMLPSEGIIKTGHYIIFRYRP